MFDWFDGEWWRNAGNLHRITRMLSEMTRVEALEAIQRGFQWLDAVEADCLWSSRDCTADLAGPRWALWVMTDTVSCRTTEGEW